MNQTDPCLLTGLSVQMSHTARNISSCALKQMILNTNENTEQCKTSWRKLGSIRNGNTIPRPPPACAWTLHSGDTISKIKNNHSSEPQAECECSKPALLISNPLPVPQRTAVNVSLTYSLKYFGQSHAYSLTSIKYRSGGLPYGKGTKPL